MRDLRLGARLLLGNLLRMTIGIGQTQVKTIVVLTRIKLKQSRTAPKSEGDRRCLAQKTSRKPAASGSKNNTYDFYHWSQANTGLWQGDRFFVGTIADAAKVVAIDAVLNQPGRTIAEDYVEAARMSAAPGVG